jgi:threonine dehydratase
LSDGTAGGVEAKAITFDLCRSIVDDYVLVSETQIANAMRSFIDAHHMLLEGAAGVALAGLNARAEQYRGKNVVVIVCGGNISRDTLRQVI